MDRLINENAVEDRYCERMDFPNTFNEFAEQYGFTDKEEHYTNGSQLIPVFRVKQWLNHIPNNSENMTVEQYRARMIEAFQNADCNNLIALVSLPMEKEFEHLEWLLKNYYKKQSNSDEDCISRQAVIDGIDNYIEKVQSTGAKDDFISFEELVVKALPSIQPKAKENLVVEDCISRAELLKAVDTWDKFGCDANNKLVRIKDCYVPYIRYDDVVKAIKGMPSIQPKPKTDVLDKIRTEIIQMPTISFNANDIYKADVLAIIDKYKTESEGKE